MIHPHCKNCSSQFDTNVMEFVYNCATNSNFIQLCYKYIGGPEMVDFGHGRFLDYQFINIYYVGTNKSTLLGPIFQCCMVNFWTPRITSTILGPYVNLLYWDPARKCRACPHGRARASPGPARPWRTAWHFRAGSQYSRFSHGPKMVDCILKIM